MTVSTGPTLADVLIFEYIEPIDRGYIYEDPLDDALRENALGEVTGGGTQMHDELGIDFVSIELQLTDVEKGLALTKELLEKQGAPKGSRIVYADSGTEKTIEFGTTECVAVFFDGVGLPAEVYEKADFGDIMTQVNDSLQSGSLGQIHGTWSAETETAIFIYGADAAAATNAIRPLFDTIPLMQNARIVTRYRPVDGESTTFRVPMQ